MIKLLIADDEAYIRQGLSQCIDWIKYEIDLVGQAVDGQDALEKAGQFKPDIILTDIQMPLLNGLEMVEKIKNIYPQIKIIILTAYGQPENYSKAIQIGVDGFVLKNANAQAILDSILEMKSKILSQNKKSLHISKAQNFYQENQHLVLSTLFMRFLTNRLSLHNFKSKLATLDFSFKTSAFSLFLARVPQNDDVFILEKFHQALKIYHPIIFYADNYQVLAITQISPSHPISAIKLEEIYSQLQSVINQNAFIVFPFVEQIDFLPLCYQQTCEYLNLAFWETKMPYILVDQAPFPKNLDFHQLYTLESIIAQQITNSFPSDLASPLHNLFRYWHQQGLSKTETIHSATRILLPFYLKQHHNALPTEIFSALNAMQTPQEIKTLITQILTPLSNEFSSIDLVLQYIKNNYQSNISLLSIANHTYLSPTYISRIFKTQTGYSLTDYINRLRIDKAKELLVQSNKKHYEIAELVGYKNYKYFSSYFFKYNLCSAGEYRLKHQIAPEKLVSETI